MYNLFMALVILPLALWMLIKMLIGREAMAQMVGILAADVVRFLFLAPFRILRWFARRIGIIP